jgi:hypothetical protein
MTTYTYRCPRHGTVDVRCAFGAAPRVEPCPTCGEPMPRSYTPPLLGSARADLVAQIDRAERSASEPEVVRTLPRAPRPRRAPAANPALARLPRP